ncbi:lipin, Nterminal containing protein [Acanthamoeba castellanii str. Neff]|uniref:phosphatidate phosphatase n=1 Tax=Acanthamoeba castellanii (strain ATCC 30010 / Neff) TaxID=1257118 RepID=L8HCT1_ACACF|nr:lipin, Nterminal containing protein [Acanthamoeba castellanii str. Neff]ELR23354.1 lipin, Nterminal containing protein [Acanthamoeba castellanii str. Neff]
MWSGVRDFFDFSRGSIDVLVVQQEDGSYASTPFHIRFGRGQLLREEEKIVHIAVNGEDVEVKMRLGEAGEAYFEVDPRKNKGDAQAEEEEVEQVEETIEMAEESAGVALPVAAAVADLVQEPTTTAATDEPQEPPAADQPDQSVSAAVDAAEQPGTRWTWGWGLLPSRRQVNSPVASPSSSFSDLPKLASFGEGESHLHDSVKMSSPIVPRPRRNSLHDLLSESGGYASDGDKSGQDVGWKRKWGMGALIDMLKPKEAEPVYLIKPADSDFLSGFPDDDEDGEDEYFYSAVSPRECASPTSIPRNHSLERLYLDDVARQLENEDMLEMQASEIEQELEREDRMANDAEHDARQGAESEREEEGDDQEAAEASTTPESEGKGKAEGGGSNDLEDKTARSDAATDRENGGEEKDMNESEKEKEAEKSESEEAHGLTTTEGERPEPVSAKTNQEKKSERESYNEAGEKVELTPPVVARSLEGEEHWATEQHVKEKEEETQQQEEEAQQEKSVTTDDEEQRASDDDLPTPAMESKGDEKARKRLFSDELNNASEAPNENGEMTVALSLCGDILPNTASELAERVFEEHRLSSEEFWKDPSGAMADSRLVVRIRDKVYSGKEGVALIVSHLAFGRSVTVEAAKALNPIPKGKVQAPTKGGRAPATPTRSSSSWRWWWSSSTVPTSTHHEAKQSRTEGRTLRPTSEQLAALGLKEGANKATFIVRSEAATQEVTAMIYLWSRFTKIVISDIDGTITKSDLLGHILPIVGRDWSHSGIAHLYSNIYENGYRILYVSSRSIGQANLTRGYISALRQEDVSLPEGPVFTSPNGLIRSVHREVIRRNPEEFKIACLKDIAALFPHGNPFYAGFGNRPSDAFSYLTVGVPKGKIFTINQRGEITMSNRTYKRSYMKLNEVVHEMFPAINQPPPQEEFNQFQYWRVPELDVSELEPL